MENEERAAEPFTKLPNVLLDHAHTVSASAFMVICVVARKTIGWHKQGDIISLTQIEAATGLSRNTVLSALNEALQVGWIKRMEIGTMNGQSYTYEFCAIDTSSISAPVQKLNRHQFKNCTTTSSNSELLPVQKLNTQKKGKERSKETGKKTSRARKRDEVVSSNPVDDDDPFSEGYDLAKLAPTLAALGQLPEQTTVESIPDAPKPKRERKSKATLTPEESARHAELFDGLARICVVDAKLVGGQIARYAKQLRTADAEANGATCDAFLEWWKTSDFRGKQGKPPMLSQIVSSWKMFRGGYAEHPAALSNDKQRRGQEMMERIARVYNVEI